MKRGTNERLEVSGEVREVGELVMSEEVVPGPDGGVEDRGMHGKGFRGGVEVVKGGGEGAGREGSRIRRVERMGGGGWGRQW